MQQCTNRHTDAVCDQPEGNHAYCLGWSQEAHEPVVWPNPAYEPPKVMEKRSAGGKLSEMAARVSPATSVQDQDN